MGSIIDEKIKEIKEEQQQMHEEDIAELKEILKKIEAGEKNTENYYFAFNTFQLIDEDIFKQEIENYAQLAEKSAYKDIEQNYEVAEAYHILSVISEYKNDKENMMRYINKAIELEPSKPIYYLARAAIYNRMGKKNDANKDYDKVCELEPEMTDSVKILRNLNQSNIMKDVVFPVLLVICVVIGFMYFFK